mgnify:CR=1 FL=1
MSDDHRDGCMCHGCVCSRYELEIHSLTNYIEHERADAEGYREDLAVVTREALKTIEGLKAELAACIKQAKAEAFEAAAKECEHERALRLAEKIREMAKEKQNAD